MTPPDAADVAAIAWIATAVGMVVHVVGVLAGWWSVDGPLWWVVLALLLVQSGAGAVS